jgi:hypothetical protein
MVPWQGSSWGVFRARGTNPPSTFDNPITSSGACGPFLARGWWSVVSLHPMS